jgi:hypothetical protein
LATGVSSQGKGVGLIEVVEKAETTSRIHWVSQSVLISISNFIGIWWTVWSSAEGNFV